MAEQSPEQEFDAYRRGWIAGAGFKSIDPGAGHYWNVGWESGRQAFRQAMEEYRQRNGMPPAQLLRPAKES